MNFDHDPEQPLDPLHIYNGSDSFDPAIIPSANPVGTDLLKAFESVTGWTLEFNETPASYRRRQDPGMANSPSLGNVTITDMSEQIGPDERPCPRYLCDELAAGIDLLVQELQRAKIELFNSRAELATQIPVVVSPEESYRLAQLLSQILQSACDAVDGTSAAMYLIDDKDEFLCLRSSVGLPSDRPLNEQRLLATSVADVEALCGNAIVISDRRQAEIWNSPHGCESAACIPIASSTTCLGTLWVYSDREGGFGKSQTNTLEIIAGRLAAELERESIIRQSVPKHASETELQTESQQFSQDRDDQGGLMEIEKDSRLIESLVVNNCTKSIVDPPFEGWLAGGELGIIGADFLEWTITDDEEILIVCGSVEADEVGDSAGAAGMGLIATRMFLDSNSSWISPEQVVCEVRELLPALAPDCQLCSITCLMINPLTGEIRLSEEAFAAGQPVNMDCQIFIADGDSVVSTELGDRVPESLEHGMTLVIAPTLVVGVSRVEKLIRDPYTVEGLANAVARSGEPRIVLRRN